MPTAFKIIIKSDSNGILPGNQGPAVHGLFLNIISRSDAQLAEVLHEGSGQHPFTLSPPYLSKGSPGDSFRHFSEETEAAVRLCVLDDALTQRIYNALLNAMKIPCIKLCGFDFSLAGLLIENALTYGQIVQGAQDAAPVNKFRFDFYTPTAFKHEDKSMLFPQIDYILGGLEKRWNQYTAPLDKVYVREMVSKAYPAQYRLKTSILELAKKKNNDASADIGNNIKTDPSNGKYYKSGFTGFCIYETEQLSEEANTTLVELLIFAGFSGIGHKTTMGMGLVRSEVIA